MSWKKLPAWLKGAIVSEIILIILFAVSFICDYTLGQNCFGAWCESGCFFPIFHINWIAFHTGVYNWWAMVLTGIAIHFIVGALIGFIVGKIKKK